MKNIELLLINLKWYVDIWSQFNNEKSKTFTTLFDLHFDLNHLNNILNNKNNNYLTEKYNIKYELVNPINKDYIELYTLSVMNKILSLNLEKILKIPKKATLEQINDSNQRKKIIINCINNFKNFNTNNK